MNGKALLVSAAFCGIGIAASAIGPAEDFYAPYVNTSLARRSSWMAKAEAAKPQLNIRAVRPVRLVKPVRDNTAFQRWRMEYAGDAATIESRTNALGYTSFTLDFGEHLVGHLRFDLRRLARNADSPVRLKLRFAEVPSECADPIEPFDRKHCLSRSWIQDETVTFDEVPSQQTLPRRYAFRYVNVEVLSPAAFGLGNIVALAETSADPSALRRWSAPDATAAALDKVACRTLRDCMQTMFEDGPKRDRRLWLGDLRLEALANYETFGNHAIVKRCLYMFAGLSDDRSLVHADAYERPTPSGGDCRILDYTALFATTVLEYLDASGDRETAEDLWPLCVAQLKHTLGEVGDDGLFHNHRRWWLFIDHAKLDRQAPEQGAIIYGAVRTYELAKRLGHADDVAFVPDVVGKMREAARRWLWDPDRRLFVSGDDRTFSHMGQAWLVIGGAAQGKDARDCLLNAMGDRESDLPKTPYAYHYLIEALNVAGLRREADDLLRSYWGGMLKKGADTFWEAYDPEDDFCSPYANHLMTSYCHAWSCAPAYFLRRAAKLP